MTNETQAAPGTDYTLAEMMCIVAARELPRDGVGDRAGYIQHYIERFGQDALDRTIATDGPSPQDGIRYSYAPTLPFRMDA